MAEVPQCREVDRMKEAQRVKIGPLKESELAEADRIFRLAFATFIGLPEPTAFWNGRELFVPRWRAPHVKSFAAREDGRLIGSNMITRWGSFAFFGPLTVLPEYWNRGVAQLLLEATVTTFARQGFKRTGLFTFPHSTKHVALYQKFGYWPGYLTALMAYTPDGSRAAGGQVVGLSTLAKSAREEAIAACARLTDRIDKGLDLTEEIRSVLKQKVGEVVLTYTRNTLDGFAICLNGPGSEGGEKTCYIKFAAARGGVGGGERFDALLDACDGFALSRAASIEAGMNFAREDAYRRMRAHGFKTFAQGVTMQNPHVAGHNRADVYVIDDWR
jgi:GNAT superfamily N-acetyltransferase